MCTANLSIMLYLFQSLVFAYLLNYKNLIDYDARPISQWKEVEDMELNVLLG